MSDRDRIKYIEIPRRSLLDCLSDGGGAMLFTVSGIPRDAEVVSEHFNHITRSWQIMLRHSDFPVVPEGQIPERIETTGIRLDIPTYLGMMQELVDRLQKSPSGNLFCIDSETAQLVSDAQTLIDGLRMANTEHQMRVNEMIAQREARKKAEATPTGVGPHPASCACDVCVRGRIG